MGNDYELTVSIETKDEQGKAVVLQSVKPLGGMKPSKVTLTLSRVTQNAPTTLVLGTKEILVA